MGPGVDRSYLLAVARAWASVCTSGYDANWNDYFDYAKAKALAKV
jgi:hypothetical protein